GDEGMGLLSVAVGAREPALSAGPVVVHAVRANSAATATVQSRLVVTAGR
ncbi:MAG: hypothetical protein QOE84_2637, partial [Actinomycetota bacterium]|nr:hypothetical protein [Actinomycetota bacterium]